MMKPGRVDRFLDIEGEIHNADEDVGDSGDDGGAAGRSENEEKLAVFDTMVGVMAESGRLPGPMALAGPWISP
jgi:hypothetical protein